MDAQEALLRADLQAVYTLLWDFKGTTAKERVESAIEHIEWLRRELNLSKYNENAAYQVLEQERRERR